MSNPGKTALRAYRLHRAMQQAKAAAAEHHALTAQLSREVARIRENAAQAERDARATQSAASRVKIMPDGRPVAVYACKLLVTDETSRSHEVSDLLLRVKEDITRRLVEHLMNQPDYKVAVAYDPHVMQHIVTAEFALIHVAPHAYTDHLTLDQLKDYLTRTP